MRESMQTERLASHALVDVKNVGACGLELSCCIVRLRNENALQRHVHKYSACTYMQTHLRGVGSGICWGEDVDNTHKLLENRANGLVSRRQLEVGLVCRIQLVNTSEILS